MSRIETFKIKSNADGLELSVLTVAPEGEPKALVQLAHGMAEHKERYLPFMQFLAEHGYACLINDHRGHGASVKSPDDLGYFYAGGADALLKDLHQLTLWFRTRYPGRKLFLFGHSMGALSVNNYRHRYAADIDALVICGNPGRNPAAGAGLALNKLMTLFKGERYISKLFVSMTTGSFSKRHPDPNTQNAWLSTNQDNVRAYDADPLCGFPFTLNGYKALLTLMRDAYVPAPAANPALPVFFVSGEDDPCAPDEKGFNDAVSRMKADGYTHVTAKRYPGMRHELLNHTNHQIVYDDLLAFFDGQLAE
ncbi:MAG: alpha/beta fold hydrolase [Clostridia bacterium]|nr:alpha/beta fold hydrolase [Clostridia bacterium]